MRDCYLRPLEPRLHGTTWLAVGPHASASEPLAFAKRHARAGERAVDSDSGVESRDASLVVCVYSMSPAQGTATMCRLKNFQISSLALMS